MPTYDYVCDHCEHAFELFQQMTDSVKRKCPECGKQKLRRLVGTGAGVIFRGSGFYETDYRSDSYKKAAEAEKPSKTDKDKDKVKDKVKDEKPKAEGSKTPDGGSLAPASTPAKSANTNTSPKQK